MELQPPGVLSAADIPFSLYYSARCMIGICMNSVLSLSVPSMTFLLLLEARKNTSIQ